MRAWNELLLKENQNIGFVLREGAVFAVVTAKEFFKYRYTGSSLSSNEQSDFDTLTDAEGRNILEVRDSLHCYHLFIGIRPRPIRMFIEYPKGERIGNLDIKPVAVRETWGYICGNESPFQEPTERGELFVVKGVDVAFSFWNPTDTTLTPELNIVGERYKLRPIKEEEIINGIIERRIPCRLVTVGGLRPVSFEETLKDWEEKFGVRPVRL